MVDEENKTQENTEIEYIPIEELQPQHELVIRLAVTAELPTVLDLKQIRILR